VVATRANVVRSRRLRIIEAVISGKTDAGRAADLIRRDSQLLAAAASSPEQGRPVARARLALVRVRPRGWRYALWLPVPLGLAGLALRLTGAIEHGGEGMQVLAGVIRRMPRCGKAIEVQDEDFSLEIWLF